MYQIKDLKSQRGFTLIELLVVMGILSVLAGLTIAAVNPLEMINKSIDSNNYQATHEVGKSIQRYIINKPDGLPEDSSWASSLVNSNELNTTPDEGGGCADTVDAVDIGGFCYDFDSVSKKFMVFTKAKSQMMRNTPVPVCDDIDKTYIVFSSEFSRSGVVCSSTVLSNPSYGVKPQ